ncbi:Resolvase, N terminal domain [Rhizobiales bacterium GAS188]|nr:Resolvase, N terminal domain [Rhizobiales bacterium GAS188]
MTSGDLLPAAVLKREAVVYVRQSTQAQVQTNLESQRRQYELVDVARHHGFREIEVVDDDLGRSASGMVARPGFERLVAWLCAGEVGAVLCFDASRFARNGRDWHHLLELCGLVEARGPRLPSLSILRSAARPGLPAADRPAPQGSASNSVMLGISHSPKTIDNAGQIRFGPLISPRQVFRRDPCVKSRSVLRVLWVRNGLGHHRENEADPPRPQPWQGLQMRHFSPTSREAQRRYPKQGSQEPRVCSLVHQIGHCGFRFMPATNSEMMSATIPI